MSGDYNPGPYVPPEGVMHLVGWKHLTDRQTEYIDTNGARQTEWSEIYIFRWVGPSVVGDAYRGNPSADDVLRDPLCPKLYWTADEIQQLFGNRFKWRDGKVRSVQCTEIQRLAGDLDWTAQFDPAYTLPQESLWEVLVNFSTDIEEAEDGPPHLRRPKYNWGTETVQVAMTEDVIENDPDTNLPVKIQNVNGQYLLPEGPETLAVLTVSKYEGPGRDFNPEKIFDFANHVNRYYFFGAPPKCALCASVTADEEFMTWTDPVTKEKKQAWYNKVTYVFKFKFRWFQDYRLRPQDPENITDEEKQTTAGWLMKLLHVGTLVRQKDPDLGSYTLVPPEANGMPKTDPVPLSDEDYPDGEGYEIPEEDPNAEAYKNWLYFNRYPTADFRCLEVDYVNNPDTPSIPIPVCSDYNQFTPISPFLNRP